MCACVCVCVPVSVASYMSRHHSHAVSGEGSCLVGADGGGVTHGLTGVQVPHQVVVLHHFLQRGAIVGYNDVRP